MSQATPSRRIVSLGTSCHVAQFLKDAGLRSESTPFDWLFSTPEAVAHMLQDDFACFLDRAQYVPHGDEPKSAERAGHARYHPRMFHHRNPRRPEDYDYFVRCVERFRDLRESAPDCHFVVLRTNQRGLGSAAVYEEIHEALVARMPEATLLAVHHVPDGETSAVTPVLERPGLRVVRLSGSRSDGRRFEDARDEERFRELVFESRSPGR